MRFNLGEFEEIVLLVVAGQEEAYGLSVTNAIEEELKRSVTLSSVHTALYRLEEKDLLESSVSDSSENRRGRKKRVFKVTSLGKKALLEAREARNHLWSMIPNYVFK